MKKALLVVAMAVTLALFTGGWYASAQDGDDNQMLPPDDEFSAPPMDDDAPAMFMGPGMQEKMKELGITEEQAAKLQEARTAHMKEMIEIGAKLRVAQIELRDLMKTQGNDQAVLAKHNEINSIRTEIGDLRLRHQLAQRAVFTAEQWEKVGKFIGIGMMKGRGGRGGSFGQRQGRHPGMSSRGGMHQRSFNSPRSGRMMYR